MIFISLQSLKYELFGFGKPFAEKLEISVLLAVNHNNSLNIHSDLDSYNFLPLYSKSKTFVTNVLPGVV